MGLNKINTAIKISEKVINDLTYVFTFGKYKKLSIEEVLEIDPQYLIWLHENSDQFTLSFDLLEKAEDANAERRYKRS